MNLSPTARTLLTAVASAVTALGGLIAAGTLTDAPEWLGVTVAVLGAVFAGLGIVPPQTGGTQTGVVSPSISEPPAADIHERGEVDVVTVGAVLGIAAFVLVLVILL